MSSNKSIASQISYFILISFLLISMYCVKILYSASFYSDISCRIQPELQERLWINKVEGLQF